MTRILVALAALAIGAVASAQFSDQPNDLGQAAVGFSFRVGGYFPADQKVRNVENVFSDVGVEYEFERSWVKNGKSYVAGDWISNTFIGGQHYGALTINQRFYTKDQRFAAGGSPYYFLGVGGGWLHLNGVTDTSWAVHGGVGSEFKGDYFIEIGGFLSPKLKGINPSGVAASLGYRFRD